MDATTFDLVCSIRLAIVLESFGSGVNTILIQETKGNAIPKINQNEWNGGKKHISTLSIVIQDIIHAAQSRSCKIFL